MRLRLVFVKILRTAYLIKNISITQLEKNAPSGRFLSEIEEIFRRNIEYLRESEYHVERDPDVPEFNGGDMRAVYVDRFGKLQLCVLFLLAVEHYVQTECFIQWLVCRFHALPPCFYYHVPL